MRNHVSLIRERISTMRPRSAVVATSVSCASTRSRDRQPTTTVGSRGQERTTRHGARKHGRASVLLACLLVCMLGWLPHARAQVDAVRAGLSSNGLCGLALTAYPVCPKRLGVSVTGNYGYTESLGPIEGAHHRTGGSIGAGMSPLPWLSVALRLDGRLDFHPRDRKGKDFTGTGDPRLFVRGGHQLSRELALGGELVMWFPGRDAPSFKASATSLDVKALAAFTARTLPLSLLGHVGYRLDQSAESAPDLGRVRYGDRSALGLSASDAVLLAIGLSTRAVRELELYGELSLDLLVGDAAPAFAQSPLRGTLGARHFFTKSLQGELSATVSFSGRPSIEPTAPLVPIEPRFLLNVGVRYGYDLYVPPPAPREPPPQRRVEVAPGAPVQVPVSGKLVDGDDAALPDVRVVLTAEGPPAQPPIETVTDGEGRYSFPLVPLGPASLEASAPGFEVQRWTIDVQPQMAADDARPLARQGNLGTLRLLTRTFKSEPLASAIVVRDVRGRKVAGGTADTQGLFEFDLPPGRYVVMISAVGYRPHRREVQIERHGVAILNVDMREQQ
jgi:hypothetical protein